MCEHHYHYLGTELHRLSPERDREDGGVRTKERESVPRRESVSVRCETPLALGGWESNTRPLSTHPAVSVSNKA